MFKLTHPLPDKYWVAVSGGVDSMAALHWLNKPSRRNSLLGVLHVNHGTGDYANHAEMLVTSHCYFENIKLEKVTLEDLPPDRVSKEEWWRNKRYEFLTSVREPVVLGHNFDDCLEEYIMCTMVRGYSSTIKYSYANCIRPFRLWKRTDIRKYAERNDLHWAEDPTNIDTKYKRNYIRHELVPRILELNPGVYNIVERLISSEC